MQFRDLKKQYEALKPEMDAVVLEVLEQSKYINGPQIQELESNLSEYVGVNHCITCANGTDALSMAMMVWEIGRGDAVFVPDFTFFSSGEIVSFAGATPVFVDVNKDTFNIDTDALELAIQKTLDKGILTPRCIIAVDLFGLPADYMQIRKIADKYDLLLLEDAAQGFGGKINNKMSCSFGDISTTSFFPAKPLGCYGDGGAVFTDDEGIADKLKSIKEHGKGNNKYDNVRIGLNSRLDSIQAAVLSVKFKSFIDYELEDINNIADKYTELLSDYCITPIVPKGYYSSWAQYTIRLTSRDVRDNLQLMLKETGIPTMVYYTKPMHEQSVFSNLDIDYNNANTKELTQTVLSLPIHPYMDDQDLFTVTTEIKKIIKK